MQLQLITLNGITFEEDIHSAILPTLSGEITVLGHHQPLMSALKTGVITIRRSAKDPDNKLEQYATYGGVVEIANSKVRILVDEADHGDEINLQEAEAARAEAERLKSNAKNQQELHQAQMVLDRQAVRLHVAKLRHRNRR